MEQRSDGCLILVLIFIGFVLFVGIIAALAPFFTLIYQKYIPGFHV